MVTLITMSHGNIDAGSQYFRVLTVFELPGGWGG